MKVSVIYMSSIYSLNGASKVVKSFMDYSNEFRINGVEIQNVYTPMMNTLNENRNKNIISYKTKIKKTLANSFIGSIISIYVQYFRNAKNALNNYSLQSDKSEDLLIFHDIFSCYLYYKKFNNNAKKSILVLHTNGDTWKMVFEYFPKLENPLIAKILNRIEEYVCEKTNRIVFVSETSMENFIKRKKKYKDKTSYIYNGIGKVGKLINRDFSELKMITVGTLNSRKSQELILKAMKRVNDNSIKLSLVGHGEKLEELLLYTKEHNLQEQVDFLGSRDDVIELLSRHNLFIMTSKDEGLPVSIIEAMQCGLPIIATDVGGIKELIQGNGLLVEPSVDSIASAIEKINKNKNILYNMSSKSHDLFVNKFELSKMIECYSDLAKEVYNGE